jgi:hypothetical protein
MDIDIGRSVTYPFEDPQWTTKLGILVIIGFIPGLNIIVWGGYALSIARNVMRREAQPLPTWENWSDIAVRGLLSIAATGIYYLPVILLSCCLYFGSAFISGRDSGFYTLLNCCGVIFSIIYSLAVNLVLNAGHVRYVQTDQFYTYLEIGRRFQDIRTDPALFVTLFAYQTVLSLVAAFVTVLLSWTCVGLIVIPTIAILANGYLLGSAAGIATRR